jgi:hypothetical protein
MFEGICEAIHKEMDMLDDKYSKGTQLSAQDLEHIDKMAHALKSLKTYEAMAGNSEYGSYDSDARGRSRMTGRYISRDNEMTAGYDPREGSYRRY